MSDERGPNGWVPSPGPWVPPAGVKPGWAWTPPGHGASPRIEAMPLWLKVWYRTPFLDRRAHVWMWHHGYWWVPPALDWSDDDSVGSGSPYVLSPNVEIRTGSGNQPSEGRPMTEGLSSTERARANERQRTQYAKEAPKYDEESESTERWFFGWEHRRWACTRANGDTLEVAIGTGLNLAKYPPDVRLTGIDITPEMLALACIRAADLDMPVRLCEGDAQALPFPDGTFDTVLCTYSMCSVPDEGRTVLEMRRVLKPGGRLILVDHVRSSVAPIYWIQRLMELAPSRGERELTRRPITHVLAAGLLIEESDRSRAGMIERLVARKP